MIKILIALYITNTLLNAFEYKNISPAMLFPQYNAAGDCSLPESVTNPAYLPLLKYTFINFTGSNPYTLDEISSCSINIGHTFKKIIGIQGIWHRFGIKEYSENYVEINTGIMPVKYISFGVGINYYNLSINISDLSISHHLFNIRASLLIIPVYWLNISFQQENLISIFDKKKRDIMFPEWSLGITIKPLKGLSIVWNINSTPFGYNNTFSINVNVIKYLILRAGYSNKTSTYSAGFSFIYKYLSVSYGLRYHSYLGITHTAGITLSLQPIQIEKIEYRNPFKNRPSIKKIKKTNINDCSLEDLSKIPIINDLIALRIIKYRNMIGPISEKALSQIGMSNKDIEVLHDYVFGLVKNKNSNIKYSKNKIKKNIFIKLIKAGLSTSSALKISEAVASGKKIKINIAINSISGIDKKKKNEIKKLCKELF